MLRSKVSKRVNLSPHQAKIRKPYSQFPALININPMLPFFPKILGWNKKIKGGEELDPKLNPTKKKTVLTTFPFDLFFRFLNFNY